MTVEESPNVNGDVGKYFMFSAEEFTKMVGYDNWPGPDFAKRPVFVGYEAAFFCLFVVLVGGTIVSIVTFYIAQLNTLQWFFAYNL